MCLDKNTDKPVLRVEGGCSQVCMSPEGVSFEPQQSPERPETIPAAPAEHSSPQVSCSWGFTSSVHPSPAPAGGAAPAPPT